jgi:hypothetical protein
MGERCDMLLPAVSDDILGVTFFAALLPPEPALSHRKGWTLTAVSCHCK